MPSAPRPDLTIIGGGIAGLAAAIAMRPLVPQLSVLEQAPARREFGAGIQLGPNGVKALRSLQADTGLMSLACQPDRLVIRDGETGRTVAASPLGRQIAVRHGAPYVTLARADLLTLLAERANALGLVPAYGARVVSVRRTGGGFALEFDDGDRRNVTTLIGADGLWSEVRSGLRPSTRTRHAGQTAWRATIQMDDVPTDISTTDVTLWLGPNSHAVHYPISAGQRLNLALFTEGATDAVGWETPGDAADLEAALAAHGRRLASPLAALVGSATNLVKWPLFELVPATVWGSGPATLVGDAAHPMLPYLAQGATMALEDAVTLEAEVKTESDLAMAFRRFERRRMRRVTKVQRAARANARVFHFGGAAAFVRNAVISLGEAVRPGALVRRYDWLYGGP